MSPRTGEDPKEITEMEIDMVPEDEFGGDECPECGAPPGQPHDPLCPIGIEEEGDPRDPDRAYDSRVDREPYAESTEFDKFMDRVILDEGRKRLIDRPEVNPQRQRAARYQDRPMNKTRFNGGR
jgi:hypothetical protein